MRHAGIILHTFFSKQNRVALIDTQAGRIDGVVYQHIGSAGVLLSYQLVRNGRRVQLEDVRIEDSPLQVAQEDILFLHHVLELCYRCIPIGSCTTGIFELLQKLYQPRSYLHARQYKKVFMYQLLVLLGVMSSSYRMSAASLQQLHALCLDTFLDDALHESSEKELDTWLQYSIAEYMDMQQLKTVQFLNLSRIT